MLTTQHGVRGCLVWHYTDVASMSSVMTLQKTILRLRHGFQSGLSSSSHRRRPLCAFKAAVKNAMIPPFVTAETSRTQGRNMRNGAVETDSASYRGSCNKRPSMLLHSLSAVDETAWKHDRRVWLPRYNTWKVQHASLLERDIGQAPEVWHRPSHRFLYVDRHTTHEGL